MAERMLLAFGRYLKLVRERRKLSLEDVATLTKSYPEPINKGYLSRVERGLARIGFSKMVALARAYDMPLDAFGEKLALDLEVDQMKDAPDTKGKSYGMLMEDAMAFNQRGMRWQCYSCVRDALPRAAIDSPSGNNRTLRDQQTAAALSHGIAAGGLGRYVLALSELEFVALNSDALSAERLPVVFLQSATALRRLGRLEEARALATRAVDLAEKAPMRRHLGDALEVHAHLAGQTGDFRSAIEFAQRAFAAYRAVGSRLDCARMLNNLAQFYFDEKRFKAARRALSAADRLARELEADSIRARARILLGEIEAIDSHHEKASALWHEAVEIARRTHDSVAHFKAEFQLFKLAILQRNTTIVNALGRRLDRMTPWLSSSEPEVSEFRQLYSIHRKPKQRSVAAMQPARSVSRNPD